MLWDQLDFVLGALALVWSRAELSWADLATILLLTFAGHVLVNHLGYWMGIRDALRLLVVGFVERLEHVRVRPAPVGSPAQCSYWR